MFLAFIGSTEILWVILIGLLLFGGKLPDVAREMGKVFFKARRTINEIRRDSGIEGALRDIERESYKVKQAATDAGDEVQKAAEIPDWRQSLDHAAGPGAEEGPEEAETSPEPPKNPDSEAINEEDPPPTETDSQQSVEKDLGNS